MTVDNCENCKKMPIKGKNLKINSQKDKNQNLKNAWNQF